MIKITAHPRMHSHAVRQTAALIRDRSCEWREFDMDWTYRDSLIHGETHMELVFRVRNLPLALYAEAQAKDQIVLKGKNMFLTKEFIIKRVPESCVYLSTQNYFTMWQMTRWRCHRFKRKFRGY